MQNLSHHRFLALWSSTCYVCYRVKVWTNSLKWCWRIWAHKIFPYILYSDKITLCSITLAKLSASKRPAFMLTLNLCLLLCSKILQAAYRPQTDVSCMYWPTDKSNSMCHPLLGQKTTIKTHNSTHRFLYLMNMFVENFRSWIFFLLFFVFLLIHYVF